jgi:hypothetical protein
MNYYEFFLFSEKVFINMIFFSFLCYFAQALVIYELAFKILLFKRIYRFLFFWIFVCTFAN